MWPINSVRPHMAAQCGEEGNHTSGDVWCGNIKLWGDKQALTESTFIQTPLKSHLIHFLSCWCDIRFVPAVLCLRHKNSDVSFRNELLC